MLSPVGDCEFEGGATLGLVIHSSDAELQDNRSLHDCKLFDDSNIRVSLRSVSPTTLARSSTSMRVSDQILELVLLIWLPSCETSKIPVELNEFDRVVDSGMIYKSCSRHNTRSSRGVFFYSQARSDGG